MNGEQSQPPLGEEHQDAFTGIDDATDAVRAAATTDPATTG